MNKLYSLTIAIFLFKIIAAQKITTQEYIDKYKTIAIAEMHRTGIPASITLAQGLLESASGNSMLAQKAKNHFGIKCHSSWKGPKIFKDDDKKHECFRKYKSAEASYIDHSNFLRKYQRYSFLFELNPTDYKAWARGLKKAGYATNPKYPQRLIHLIETHKLYIFDTQNLSEKEIIAETKASKQLKKNEPDLVIKTRPAPVEDYSFQIGYKINTNNGVKYIIAKKGDNLKKLTKKLEKAPWELRRYNELPKNAKLKQGQIIYLQPKRRKANKKYKYHIVKPGETLYSISQKYAIKTKSLIKLNKLNSQNIKPGQKLKLR
jgi:LysM repeat protein